MVRFESVMKMRNALDELGKTEGITEKERGIDSFYRIFIVRLFLTDPEEFLNMFFKHMLPRPFISIRCVNCVYALIVLYIPTGVRLVWSKSSLSNCLWSTTQTSDYPL